MFVAEFTIGQKYIHRYSQTATVLSRLNFLSLFEFIEACHKIQSDQGQRRGFVLRMGQ